MQSSENHSASKASASRPAPLIPHQDLADKIQQQIQSKSVFGSKLGKIDIQRARAMTNDEHTPVKQQYFPQPHPKSSYPIQIHNSAKNTFGSHKKSTQINSSNPFGKSSPQSPSESAGLPQQPTGQRLRISDVNEQILASAHLQTQEDGNNSILGDTLGSPSNHQISSDRCPNENSVGNLNFLERMAKQQSLQREVNPMQHTFSSLSPSHQAQHTQQPEKQTANMEEQVFINPFSIAARESDHDSNNEVTAEGFFKNPDDPINAMGVTSQFNIEEDTSALTIPPKPVKSQQEEKRVSPFDVLHQQQLKSKKAHDNFSRNSGMNAESRTGKLQIVSLTTAGNRESNPYPTPGNSSTGVYKLKRSQISIQPSAVTQDGNENLTKAQQNFVKRKESVKFKSKFNRSGSQSRDEKVATNQSPPQLTNFVNRPSYEKSEQNRNKLVGLKQSHNHDAFEKELNENKQSLATNDEYDKVDRLRSIGSSSLKPQSQEKERMQVFEEPHQQHITQNEVAQMQHQFQGRLSHQQPTHTSNPHHRKALSQSRGNPFQPASPATPGSAKMQSNYDRRQLVSHGNIGTSHSQDRRAGKQALVAHNPKMKEFQDVFSPSPQMKQYNPRLNSEQQRKNSNQQFTSLFGHNSFADPQPQQLFDSTIQNLPGIPTAQMMNQKAGGIENEFELFTEMFSPKQSSMKVGGIQNKMFQDLSTQKQTSNDRVEMQEFVSQGIINNNQASKIGAHLVKAHPHQNMNAMRTQVQSRGDINYRKISSQGLMQPSYASLEQYNTIEGNTSVDHFPVPAHGSNPPRVDSVTGGANAAVNFSSPNFDLQHRPSIGRPAFVPGINPKDQCNSSIRPVASKNIPQCFRQNHHSRGRRGVNTRDNSFGRQANIQHQKQRSFSNDARIMLHETRRLEQRFAQNQHGLNSLDATLALKQQSNSLQLDGSNGGMQQFFPQMQPTLHTSNDGVPDFQFFDQKKLYKQSSLPINQVGDLGQPDVYDTPAFHNNHLKAQQLNQQFPPPQ